MTDGRTCIIDVKALSEIAQLDEGAGRAACLVIISGAQTGRLHTIERPTVVGRSETAGVRIDEEGISREHAEFFPSERGRMKLRDLGSTNGTFVNGMRVTECELGDGDKIRLGLTTLLKFSYQDSAEVDFHRQQYESATTDPLTGCLNKRVLEAQVPAELAFAERNKRCLAAVMMDIDHFKRINDTHGHLAGDHVLQVVADTLRAHSREQESLVRYGGEEFALLMREATERHALIAAERLRGAVERAAIVYENTPIPVTISIGVAVLMPGRKCTASALLEAADECLYRAKRGGRNRVTASVLRPA